MPRPDGTMYPWERAELHQANVRYHKAVNRVKCTPNPRESTTPTRKKHSQI